jgi:lysophospholipase L1-like esterase
MATILCFGDSNTWGTSPEGARYSEQQRWTGILANNLSTTDHIIEAGQPNRTLVANFPFMGQVSGCKYLMSYLVDHRPDLVVIMLGTNDVKKRFALTAEKISIVLGELAIKVMNFTYEKPNLKNKVLIVAPPPIYEVGNYKSIYKDGSLKSQALAAFFAKKADEIGCGFFDAGAVIKACDQDGVHWQADQHHIFAVALAKKISSVLSE